MNKGAGEKDATVFRKYRPYPAYKDSGVEWLGEVPKHWDVYRLKHLALRNPSISEISNLSPNTNVSFIPMEALGEFGGLDLGRIMQLYEVKDGYTYFRNDDVLVAKITPCFENNKGAIAVNLHNGVAFGTTELHVLRANTKINVCLLFYITTSHPFRLLGQSFMYGAAGQKRIPDDYLVNFRIGIPFDLIEQRGITNFLDRETAKIDALIAKQERLIELLQEKRAALITRAVTKGLDPNVPMKDSGVEWLGEIPAHWVVKPLKRVVQINPETLPENSDPDYEFDYIEINDVDSNGVIINKKSMCFNNAPSRARRKVSRDDIIISTVRTYLKAIALIEEDNKPDLVASTGFAVLRNDGKRAVSNNFLWRMVQSSIFVEKVVSYSEGVSYPAITPYVLGSLSVWFPPYKEQNEIVLFLERALEKVDQLTDKANKSINLLKEYRAALISAAVTGKIDVRGEVSSA